MIWVDGWGVPGYQLNPKLIVSFLSCSSTIEEGQILNPALTLDPLTGVKVLLLTFILGVMNKTIQRFLGLHSTWSSTGFSHSFPSFFKLWLYGFRRQSWDMP
jgi:hypothetical protein